MDRRFILAVLLMMAIAIVPSFFLKSPARPRPATTAPLPGPDTARAAAAPPVAEAAPAPVVADEDTVTIETPTHAYLVSTRGGRVVRATMRAFRSTAREDGGALAQLVPDDGSFLGGTLLAGADTVRLADWGFEASKERTTAENPLVLTAARGALAVTMSYTFRADNYALDVRGRIDGLPVTGGVLLVDLGRGIRNTEYDTAQNAQGSAFVTYRQQAERHDIQRMDAGEADTLAGPFGWVAVKSRYFAAGLFAADTARPIAAVRAEALKEPGHEKPRRAAVQASLPVGPDGAFAYTFYLGPLQYDRLKAMGRDFDDVNPYGWPGFRTVIRFFTVPVRWLLVWMHEHLALAYGWVVVLFGILIRVVLWPLNQKAMRSSMQMQAVQPLLQEIQQKYKNDPQRLQQEQFRLFKEHNVNPLGGCWPMLLPMPVLLALFVVFQNTIELRDVPFLWLPDLSRADPTFIIPVLMGVSMFALTKIGMLGMPPNPQSQIMLWLMPVMFTVFFFALPSGLNLYYTVTNLASLPQQWLLARERLRRSAPKPRG